jgi:hypothetical protein
MKRHRCHVCSRIDNESRLVKAVFTEDNDMKWGHLRCFIDCNIDLSRMGMPWRSWRWKYNPPNPQGSPGEAPVHPVVGRMQDQPDNTKQEDKP